MNEVGHQGQEEERTQPHDRLMASQFDLECSNMLRNRSNMRALGERFYMILIRLRQLYGRERLADSCIGAILIPKS